MTPYCSQSTSMTLILTQAKRRQTEKEDRIKMDDVFRYVLLL